MASPCLAADSLLTARWRGGGGGGWSRGSRANITQVGRVNNAITARKHAGAQTCILHTHERYITSPLFYTAL